MFSIRGHLQLLLCYKIHGSGSSCSEKQLLLCFLPLLQILLLTQQIVLIWRNQKASWKKWSQQKKATVWKQTSKKDFKTRFLFSFPVQSQLKLQTWQKKAGASSICFQKRLLAANLDSFVQRKRKFRNNRSTTTILIIKSSVWNMELYYGVLQRNGVTEGTTEADGQCSVMDGECSSRSWQRATYCHSQLLDSLPGNGIIFQKEIRAKRSLEIHSVHFFKLLVLPDSRFFFLINKLLA